MWGAAQSHQSMEMLEINSLEVVSHTFHGTSPPPPKKKTGSDKILVTEKLPGSQLCPNMLCLKSLSWPLESYVTDSPRNQ